MIEREEGVVEPVLGEEGGKEDEISRVGWACDGLTG